MHGVRFSCYITDFGFLTFFDSADGTFAFGFGDVSARIGRGLSTVIEFSERDIIDFRSFASYAIC